MTKSQGKKPRAVKGALLIMVLTVMFVLIFLLAGTLAVVYSSNNRVMNKYEETQAYYTARSVLDTYIDTFLKDNKNVSGNNGTTGVTYYYINTTGGTPTLASAPAKQGRAMELDLYKLAVDLDVNTDGTQIDPGSNDSHLPDWAKEKVVQRTLGVTVLDSTTLLAHGASSSNIGNYSEALEAVRAHIALDSATHDKYVYWRQVIIDAANPIENAFKHNVGGRYAVAVPDGPTDETKPYGTFSGYYDQYVVDSTSPDNTLYYIVPAGTFSDYGHDITGSDDYGKVVDTVDQRQSYNGFAADYPDAVIQVQALERSYHIDPADDSDFKYMFDKGVRAKDYIKMKVTSTVYFDGVPTTTSIIYKTKYVPTPSADNALTAFGGINSSTNGFNVDGGMSSLDTSSTFTFNAASCSGTVFMEGDMLMDTAGSLTLIDGGSFTVKGNLWGRNAINIQANDTDKSFIYVGGEFGRQTSTVDGLTTTNYNNQINVGSASNKINVIAKRVSWPQNGVSIQGDLYTELLDHTVGNPNGVPITGNAYIQNVIFKNNSTWASVIDRGDGTFQVKMGQYGVGCNNVYLGKDCVMIFTGQSTAQTLTPQQEINKNAFAAKYGLTLTANDWFIDFGDTTMIPDPYSGDYFTLDGSATATYNFLGDDLVVDYYDQSNNGAVFGGELTSDNKKRFELPDYSPSAPGTHKKSFDLDTDQSKYGQYFADEAFIDPNDTPNNWRVGDLSCMWQFPTDGTNMTRALNPQPWDDPEVESAVHRAAAYTGSETCILPSGTPLSAGTHGAGNYVFNPGNVGDVTLDTSSGDIVVQFAAGGGNFMGNIKVIGTGKCTFLVPEDGAEYGIGSTGYDLNIKYDETFNGTNGIDTTGSITTGSASGTGLTAAPEIDIIVGGNSVVHPYRNSVVSGYVYGPGCYLKVNTDTQGVQANYVENGTNVGSSRYWLIGSAICRTYDNANVGIAYVNRNTDTSVPGDRLFGWSDVYYTRGE